MQSHGVRPVLLPAESGPPRRGVGIGKGDGNTGSKHHGVLLPSATCFLIKCSRDCSKLWTIFQSSGRRSQHCVPFFLGVFVKRQPLELPHFHFRLPPPLLFPRRQAVPRNLPNGGPKSHRSPSHHIMTPLASEACPAQGGPGRSAPAHREGV